MDITINMEIKMNVKASIFLGLSLTLPAATQAAIVSGYGVYANTTTVSNCPSYCTGDFQRDNDGGEFLTSAASQENTYAVASSSATLETTGYLPTLRVDATAADNLGGFATAFAIQGFTYDGLESSLFNLNYNLHGSAVSNPGGSILDNQVNARVAVIQTSDLPFYTHYATLVYEVAGGTRLGTDFISILGGDDINKAGSLSFMLNPGDDFYVITEVEAISKGGYADGWNTFTMSFEDDTGLTAATAVSAVPVPAAVWLFGSGLLGLVGVARRKRA